MYLLLSLIFLQASSALSMQLEKIVHISKYSIKLTFEKSIKTFKEILFSTHFSLLLFNITSNTSFPVLNPKFSLSISELRLSIYFFLIPVSLLFPSIQAM